MWIRKIIFSIFFIPSSVYGRMFGQWTYYYLSHFFMWNFWFTAEQALSFCIAVKPPWHIAFSSQSNYDSHFFHTWYCPIIAALHSGGGIYFPQRLFGVYFICRLEWTLVDYWDQEAVKSLLRPWTTRITSVCLFNKCHQGQTILPEYRAETPSTRVHLSTPMEKEPSFATVLASVGSMFSFLNEFSMLFKHFQFIIFINTDNILAIFLHAQ